MGRAGSNIFSPWVTEPGPAHGWVGRKKNQPSPAHPWVNRLIDVF